MSRFASLAKIKHQIKRQSVWKKLGSLNFNIIIAAFICLVSFLYLIQINSVAAKGFEIKDLERRIEQLKDENKKMEIQVAELESIQNVKKRIKDLDLNMVQIAHIEYITPISNIVAMNKK